MQIHKQDKNMDVLRIFYSYKEMKWNNSMEEYHATLLASYERELYRVSHLTRNMPR
jgi:hypothetical protein